MVDLPGLADDDAALVEEAAQRDDDVAGEIEPAAASGRKGWYVMYGSGLTTVTSASSVLSFRWSRSAVYMPT